jgi:UDP-N-acetylmuramoyl-tripeptide--D-alanyl-D-alanine ligase
MTVARLSLSSVAAAAGGTILQGRPDLVFADFQIDSRLVRPGDLFFAVVADRDGHLFVGDAAARGAGGAVVSRDVTPPNPGFALVKVSDTVAALQALGRAVLDSRPRRVVGITGSVGKTTTKEFAAALLTPAFGVLKSEANFNNRLGLALSLLRLEDAHDVAVLEMGTSAPGEIRALASVAPPDVAVVTNVAPVHLEFLKTLEAVAAAKREIVEGLKSGGTAVLNADDPRVRAMASGFSGRTIFFGFSPEAEVRARDLVHLGYEGLRCEVAYADGFRPVRLPFLSEGFVFDLLAALGVARAFGLDWEAVEAEIPKLAPLAKRGAILRLDRGIVVIDDSYNSSPKALETALRSYAALPAARRIAVLGDMLELGEAGPGFHEEAGRTAVGFGWDLVVAVGPLARAAAAGALGAGLGAARVFEWESSAEAAERIPGLLLPGDLVLVKGSRGVRMETIVVRLASAFKEN